MKLSSTAPGGKFKSQDVGAGNKHPQTSESCSHHTSEGSL